ncbi:MAG: hypothetical protein JRG81_12770, partial [Deltaproteobacteria bacterium]|nr:hypothetical protein [Deltaproteobacteria bacterium]
MRHLGFIKRFIFPLILVVAIRVISSVIYNSSSALPVGLVRDLLINTFGPITFFSLWFFAFIGPPIAYFRGATFIERLIVAFINPVMWIISIESKIACQFSGIEMVYFFFLPWTFGIMCVTLFEFSISEIICRFIHRQRFKEIVSVFHPAVLILLFTGLLGTYVGLIKGQEWVYMVV